MKIWTRAYRPFLMGGNVNAPIICDVPVSGPFDIGGGQQGFLAVSPKGKTFVAEGATGAIVGATIEEVKADIATGDPQVIAQQIEQAKAQVLKADEVSPETFWGMLKA